MIYGKDEFKFKAADFYPFKDQAEIDRVRAITKEDILAMNGKHPTSPSMSVNVIKNEEFEMIMLTDISELKIPFADFADSLAELGKNKGLDIHTMHEDIFNSMHRI